MSNGMFNNNPLSWWDDEPEDIAQANIKKTLEERAVNGYSFYDWINFCDYYGTLILRVCELIVEGAIESADSENNADLVVEVEGLLQLIRQVEVYVQRSDELPVHKYDERSSIDSAVMNLERIIISKFVTQILPKLPFIDGYAVPEADRYNLVNPVDYPMVGSFMTEMLKKGVIGFRTGHGYPGKYDTFKNWVTVLDYIVMNLNTNGTPIPEHAHDLLVENFMSLWD